MSLDWPCDQIASELKVKFTGLRVIPMLTLHAQNKQVRTAPAIAPCAVAAPPFVALACWLAVFVPVTWHEVVTIP